MMECTNQILLVMLYHIIWHEEDYLTSCLLVTKLYVYIARTDVPFIENTHRYTFMCDSSRRLSYCFPLIFVLLLTVLPKAVLFKLSVPPSWTKNLLVPLGTLLVSIRWKNLLEITLQYDSVLLLAVALQLVEFWLGGFGLFSFPKDLPPFCFSLPFPPTRYSMQMLKFLSFFVSGDSC